MCAALQLTDDLVEAAFPGVGGVDALRAALNESTALQREEDQKEQACLNTCHSPLSACNTLQELANYFPL